MDALERNFLGLFRFGGREPRDSFVLYAMAAFALAVLVMILVYVPLLLDSMVVVRDAVRDHPPTATLITGRGLWLFDIDGPNLHLVPAVGRIVLGATVIILVLALLLAASVSRRLHDRGRSGFGGLLPFPFLLISFVSLLWLAGDLPLPTPPWSLLLTVLLLANLLYLGSLALLGHCLIGPGEAGGNRFGPDPLA